MQSSDGGFSQLEDNPGGKVSGMEPGSGGEDSLALSASNSKKSLRTKKKNTIIFSETGAEIKVITEEELLADEELWKVSDSDSDDFD